MILNYTNILGIEYKGIWYEFKIAPNEQTYIISNQINDYIYVKGYTGSNIKITSKVKNEEIVAVLVYINDKFNCNLMEKSSYSNNDIVLITFKHYDEYVGVYLETEEMINFGCNPSCKVVLGRSNMDQAFMMLNVNDKWVIRPHNCEIYNVFINGTICHGIQTLENGDTILYSGYKIIFQGEYLIFYHQFAYKFNEIVVYSQNSETQKQFPYFKRSPRRSYILPEESILIPQIPEKKKKDNSGLLARILPTLAMVGMTVVTGLLMGRGLMMLASVGMSVITIFLSISQYYKDKKKEHEEEVLSIKTYQDRLDNVRYEIRNTMKNQRAILNQNFPDTTKELDMVNLFSGHLWEKSFEQKDFLDIRVGEGDAPLSFSIDYTHGDKPEILEDPLHKAALKLSYKYKEIKNAPVYISMGDGISAVVGNRKYAVNHVLSILTHIAVSYSYREINMVIIYPEQEESLWSLLKWLPHTWIGDRQFKAMIKDGRTKDNILGSILQMIKERKNQSEEHSNKKIRYQTTLFVIADYELIMEHGIMEFLSEDYRALGIYSLFLLDDVDMLPEKTSTIVKVESDDTAVILREKGSDRKKIYKPDLISKNDLEHISRKLSPIIHMETSKSVMPDSVTLFEIYGISDLHELNAKTRWAQNKAYKTLSVPIGLRGADDILDLNLHEKAHGPHGLVAGTTGSGKSETIQTYIASLAINFHPYSIAFLLIDYKGGGMAGLFDELPHLLGTITNLDGAQTMRALVAIKSELKRRQAVFLENNVNHIDGYQKLFEEGVAKTPIPHLFIISDEFAELKSEKPEFIRELVSAARIGRSLGVHLILATQKPTGVVDDQIWSNSKFRICLKVQNSSDSNEMIKTPDAASITQAGRGYLQVGNNEVYELFQSGYSGAEYKAKNDGSSETIDDNIYLFNDLGQTQLLTQDFSLGIKQENKQSEKVTQLDAVIDYLKTEFKNTNLPMVPRPWLPPLEDRVYLPNLIKNKDMHPNWSEDSNGLKVTLGLLDQPQFQRQDIFTLDCSIDGHIAIFGSSSMGKSTFIRTLALGMAVNYSPEILNFYIIDFGNNTILPLRDLPHTADSITVDDDEKLSKFTNIIRSEMKNRKDTIGSAGVSSIDMYKKIKGQKVPYIVILIDNFDLVKEQQMEDFEKLCIEISRDGLALGIYITFSASRSGAVRYNILSGIKNQCALFMIDKSETYNIVGRSELIPEELPGRGLVKLDGEVFSFQTALPTHSETDEESVEHFSDIMERLNTSWTGVRPKSIPILPEIVTEDFFYSQSSVKEIMNKPDNAVPLGLDKDKVEGHELNWNVTSHYLIVGSSGTGKTNALKTILKSFGTKQSNAKFIIFDNDMVKLNSYGDHKQTLHYVIQKEEIEVVLKELEDEISLRKQSYVEYLKAKEGRKTPSQFYSQYDRWIVVINNISQFAGNLSAVLQNKAAGILESSKQTGIHFVFASNAWDYTKSFDPFTKSAKTIETGLLMVPSDKQQVWALSYQMSKASPLTIGEAFDIKNGNAIRIKLPLIVSE